MADDVRVSAAADDDLTHLFDFLLDKAETVDDLDLAQAAIEASDRPPRTDATPYSFRKAGKCPTGRDSSSRSALTGYMALYEIASPSSIVVLAVRPRREEDYH